MRPNLVALSLALIAGSSPSPIPAADNPRPPNIVVLLADDQGWGDLSVTGNTNLHTPNIDALARAGATLDRFYVCPVCSPTRAEFLTGRYHLRTGVRGVDSGRERMNPDEKTVADAFKAAGYATGIFGKWHNGGQWPYHPNARGFDEFYGFTAGHWGYYFDGPLDHNGRPVRGQGYIADDLTDHALAFITQNHARPFLCYLPFNTPHSPFCVPDEYWNRFQDAPLGLRAVAGVNEDPTTTRCVLAMTANLDWNVGRILRRLDDLNLATNTIVVYFSDNGPNTWRWNGGMKGKKGSVDEGGVRSPFFIRWPGRIPAGRTVTEIAGAIDLLPTLTQLAAVPRVGPKPLDGRDLSPLLTGLAPVWPERMIFSHWAGKIGVRTPRYRLDDRGALFDLPADPGQQTDLAAQRPAVAAQLQQAVTAWRAEMFGAEVSAGATTRTGGTADRGTTDPRPIPVGYTELPRAVLPAGEGEPHGKVRRSNRFPNSTYFTNWTGSDDTMTWDLDVHQAGDYAVELQYTCPQAEAGSTVELSFNHRPGLTAKIAPAWDPPLLDRQDRVPRQESYMKDFRTLALGTIRLEAGLGPLTLRAMQIAGSQVAEVYLVALELKAPGGGK